ncbi:MAG: AMP-binding protein [Candidatus Paceibacterota bacterium]
MDFMAKFLKEIATNRDVREDALILIKANGRKEYYTWEDYIEMAIYMAKGLEKEGVKSGDRVAFIPLSLPESFFALLGIMLIGAIPVPINAPLVKEEGQVDLKKILADCQPKLLIIPACLEEYLTDIDDYAFNDETLAAGCEWYDGQKDYRHGIFLLNPTKIKLEVSGHLVDKIGTPWSEMDWPMLIMPYGWKYVPKETADVLIMPYTSGTSGDPKGVMLSHENISAAVEAIGEELAVSDKDRILSYLSLGHISDLIATFFCHLRFGYKVYFTEHAREVVKDREKLRKNFPAVLRKVKPTVFLAVPKVWINFKKQIETKFKLPMPRSWKHWLIKRALGFGEVRHYISAGAKIGINEKVFFADMGIVIEDVYGQTEAAGAVTIDGKIIGKGWVGLDPKTGEITVAGPNVMLGYWGRKEQPLSKFGNSNSYRTGDIGTQIGNRFNYVGKIGKGVKLAHGEFVTEAQIEQLEYTIRNIDPRIEEVVVCGDNKPYLVALVFIADLARKLEVDETLYTTLALAIEQAGEGIRKVGAIEILDSKQLEQTPTLKTRGEVVVKKFHDLIDRL